MLWNFNCVLVYYLLFLELFNCSFILLTLFLFPLIFDFFYLCILLLHICISQELSFLCDEKCNSYFSSSSQTILSTYDYVEHNFNRSSTISCLVTTMDLFFLTFSLRNVIYNYMQFRRTLIRLGPFYVKASYLSIIFSWSYVCYLF